MFRTALRHVMTGVGVVACAAAASASQQASTEGAGAALPAERAAALAGTWELNEAASQDDQRNWRRPVGSSNPLAGPGGGGGGGRRSGGDGMPPSMGGGGWGGGGFGGGGYIPRPSSGVYEADLRRALRDLLEVAGSLQIELKPEQVVVTDDLERTLTFSTIGRKEKHRIGATNFQARAAWDGGVFKLDIESVGDFRMTQAFVPSEDGQTLFVSITVERPEFKPPIKPITRTYRRVTQ